MLQCVSLIRYAAGVEVLAWAIFDFKFGQKAMANKTVDWSVIDTQHPHVSPEVCKDECLLFPLNPAQCFYN